MTSVERMREYTYLPVELEEPDPIEPGPGWPKGGRIQLINVSLSYDLDDGSTHMALKGICFLLPPREQIIA